MATSQRQHSPTAYSVRLPSQDQEAIHKLVDVCREAVLEYDKGNDHIRHEKGADCIRCNLAAVLWASGAPDPSFRKTERLRAAFQARIREAVDTFPEMASGVRPFDENVLGEAARYILQASPGVSEVVERATMAVRRAVDIDREIKRIESDGAEYEKLVNHHLSAVGDAESCALILHGSN